MFGGIGGKPGIGAGNRLGAIVLIGDSIGQIGIGFIAGRARVIDEIAVQIDIVFVDAPVPGKAERIERMHQHQARIGVRADAFL